MVQHWEPGTQYNNGEVVQHEAHRYKIIQPHRSQSDWAPSATPALWGRLSDNDIKYQSQQQRPQCALESGTSNEQGKSSSNEQKKQHWWDDEENRKRLEIGGGLLAGAAVIGAGALAYKEHEKKKAQRETQVLARSNWLASAQASTDKFHRDGPRGPATWVLTDGKNIPPGAILVSNSPFNMYTCRAYTDGGIQIGKASREFEKGAVIGYKYDEIHTDKYEILLGDIRGLRWVASSGKLNIATLGARPVEGGEENDGTPLFVARAYYKEILHPGKASSILDGAFITWSGKEKAVREYEVLCYL